MRELFTITCSPQPGPARPGPHGRLWTGLPVAVGLGLLLLALAGCTQASPPLSGSQDPAADPGIVTAGETPGTEPPGGGDTTQADTTQADTAQTETPVPVPRVTIKALVQYVTLGGVLRFRMTADPPPSAPLRVNLRWSDPVHVLVTRPWTVTIPTSGTADFSAATLATAVIGPRGHGDTASVLVLVGEGTGYTGANTGVGVTVRGKTAYTLVSITARPLISYEGDPVTITVTADPPPVFPITVKLNWLDTDRFAEPAPRTVKIPASGTASFALATKNDLINNYGAPIVGVSIGDGSGYGLGSPPTATVIVVDDESDPVVSVSADSTSVQEGDNLSFTLTAIPPPASDLTVNLAWRLGGDASTRHRLAGTPPDTATIPTSGTAKVTVATTDDSADNPDDTPVTISIDSGAGYIDGHVLRPRSASITIRDND
ncbi:MAG: hypothetical protein OXJ62_05875 [Spirochaetaceae bacterium]|nr:hypothetical protein [Spirochaetaceae bacterium]